MRREIVVHQAGIRPVLLFGAERELALSAALISALLIIIVTTWYSVAVGIVFWPIAIYGLRKLATYDPQFFAIYRRHIRYAPLYKAHGTPWVHEKTKWGW